MHEGKIIKFYREKANLTQGQLGIGICSDTHISKIERGITDYSPEVTQLLACRLGIHMEQELANFSHIKIRLQRWHDVMIMGQCKEMEEIKAELEGTGLIRISDYQPYYKLLLARYFLIQNQPKKSYKIIKDIEKHKHNLPLHEGNLLTHVLGLYYLSTQDYFSAIRTLNRIHEKDYSNPEFYYHLAVAYHMMQSKVMSYFYAEKSLRFFKEMNYFLRVIDAEMLMFIQVQDEVNSDFKEAIEHFKKLLQSSDMLQAYDRKAKVLHNLAYEYYRKKEYEPASSYYKQSMELKDKQTGPYLLSLEGYVRSCLEGNLEAVDQLTVLTQEGLSISKEINDPLYSILFNLLDHLIQRQDTLYYQYLQDKALPMFRKHGYTFLIEKSEKELFSYYYNTNQTEKALELAHALMNRNT